MRAGQMLCCVVMVAATCAIASAQFGSSLSVGTGLPGPARMSVEFGAHKVQYNEDGDTWEASGACKVTFKVEGEYEGTIQAPALTMKEQGRRRQVVIARGPATLKLVLSGDAGAGQVEVVAACREQAALDSGFETIVLSGGATADVRSLGEGEAQPGHFAGDTITLCLRPKTIAVMTTIPGCSSEAQAGEAEQ